MALEGKRIFTCTPVAFHGDARFFTRDTGLICMNLRRLGAESKSIMPLPFHDGDLRDDLIRVPLEQLRSAAWWKTLRLDGVVLYSWGAPRYTAIARAIKSAGIKLVIHLDTNGDFFDEWWTPRPSFLRRCKNLVTHTAIDFLRARHLRYADVVTMSPPVAEQLRHRLFYGTDIVTRMVPMPTPVDFAFAYDGRAKQRKVIFVGRWSSEDEIKDPGLMMATACELAMRDSSLLVEIYGWYDETVENWYGSIPAEAQRRICLKGFTPSRDLVGVYNDAMVSVCTSKREGTHIASAEAVCCGCSIAVPWRRSLLIPQWYTTQDSGTVAAEDTPASLAAAVLTELAHWDSGHRNPHAIAAAWQPLFHADKVMERIFG